MEIFNENVLYIIEALKCCEELCNSSIKLNYLNETINKNLFHKVVNQMNTAIKVCLKCNESNIHNKNSILFEIFTFLLSNYFEISSLSFLNCVKLPILSADIIINIAIENELQDMEEVTEILCFHLKNLRYCLNILFYNSS
jgi:hypothetical protein